MSYQIDSRDNNKTSAIELLGPPGAGKTTAYNFLQSKVSRKEDWTLFDLRLRMALANYSGISKIKGLIIKSNFMNKATRMDYRCLSGIAHELVLDASKGFSPVFFELFLKQFTEVYTNVGPHKGLSVAEKFRRDISSTWLISKSKEVNNEPFVWDEGLSHFFVSLFSGWEEDNDIISKYYSNMPLPFGLIVFEAPVEVLLERYINRELSLKPRKSKNDIEKEGERIITVTTNVYRSATEILSKRGTIVEVINGNKKKNELENDILNAVRKISASYK